jgi:hypothetical protein
MFCGIVEGIIGYHITWDDGAKRLDALDSLTVSPQWMLGRWDAKQMESFFHRVQKF